MKVAILLTTWNSSRFLAELLDSILAQSYKDWCLYVRDDGSTDDTKVLLAEYANRDGRIHLMPSDCNLGPMVGFMRLLQQVEADLYMFCDHDDVWLPTKIEESVRMMIGLPDWRTTPLVVCTDLRVVDEQLRTIAPSFWRQQHYPLNWCNDRWFHLAYNNIPGCTMLFNIAARNTALPYPPEAQMHDSWLAACVLWNGGRVIPIEKPTILYRQHSTNVLGSTPVPSFASQLRHLPMLWRKVRMEWHAVRHVAHIGFLRFLVVKLYYMTRIHLKL